MSCALVWLAGAIWLVGARRMRLPSRRTGPTARRVSDRWLRWLACLAAAAVPVATLRPAAGAAVAVFAVPVTHTVMARLQARDRRRVDPATMRAVPLMLDLLAAVLRSGQPVPAALGAVAPVIDGAVGRELGQVAGMLRLGADPSSAWRELARHPVLAPVARTASRSAQSGIRLAHGFEQLAAEMREEYRAAALARAHRAGVWTMAPLGLCFLPAFICLGVIPVVAGIARDVYPGVTS